MEWIMICIVVLGVAVVGVRDEGGCAVRLGFRGDLYGATLAQLLSSVRLRVRRQVFSVSSVDQFS